MTDDAALADAVAEDVQNGAEEVEEDLVERLEAEISEALADDEDKPKED